MDSTGVPAWARQQAAWDDIMAGHSLDKYMKARFEMKLILFDLENIQKTYANEHIPHAVAGVEVKLKSIRALLSEDYKNKELAMLLQEQNALETRKRARTTSAPSAFYGEEPKCRALACRSL